MSRAEDAQISAVVANSLITKAPLSEAQLETAYRHYKTLADLLAISGPKFVDARESARELGNLAMDRLRTIRTQRAEEERRAREQDDGLERIV